MQVLAFGSIYDFNLKIADTSHLSKISYQETLKRSIWFRLGVSHREWIMTRRSVTDYSLATFMLVLLALVDYATTDANRYLSRLPLV